MKKRRAYGPDLLTSCLLTLLIRSVLLLWSLLREGVLVKVEDVDVWL